MSANKKIRLALTAGQVYNKGSGTIILQLPTDTTIWSRLDHLMFEQWKTREPINIQR